MLKSLTTDMLFLNREGDTSKVVKICIRLSVNGDCPRSPIVVQRALTARQKNFQPPADFGFTIDAHAKPKVGQRAAVKFFFGAGGRGALDYDWTTRTVTTDGLADTEFQNNACISPTATKKHVRHTVVKTMSREYVENTNDGHAFTQPRGRYKQSCQIPYPFVRQW